MFVVLVLIVGLLAAVIVAAALGTGQHPESKRPTRTDRVARPEIHDPSSRVSH